MKNKKLLFGLIFSIIFSGQIFGQSQGVSITTDNSQPDPSAMLDIKSNNKGVLFPRLTSAERDVISNPAIGLMIFNTSRKCMEFYTGTEWTSSAPAGTIKPFAGETDKIPDGWFLCDGSSKSATEYPDLFNPINVNWGGTYPTFNLPDLRGQFLRGADLGAGNDPDFVSRTGGSLTEKIGSKQTNSTAMPNTDFTNISGGSHAHGASGLEGIANDAGVHAHHLFSPVGGTTTLTGSNTAAVHSTTPNNSEAFIKSDDQGGLNPAYGVSSYQPNHYHTLNITGNTASSGNHTHTILGGDNETRPENIYVNYIIKY